MMSILAILVVVVLNLVPSNVTTFNMQMNENDTIRFTRQSDGGWNAVKLPKNDLGTFYVDGAKLTMKGEGKKYTQDISTMLGVDKDTDWKKLKEVKFGDSPLQIERKEDGLDLILTEKDGDRETKQTFKVRWDNNELK